MRALGKYEILEQLGTGSVGTVYRARDTVLDRLVALKIILTDGDESEEQRARFYREARVCAKLQHPSIVVIHDLGEVDRVSYIAMELLSGQDFRHLIEQRQDFPLPVKLKAMARICEALAYAHRQDILHRDIKPSNLFLMNDRQSKILDFGIARIPSSRLTAEGKILGTPNYMSPEQIQGKATDGRSDLFSAAVVFFEFLVYAHPFQAEMIPRRIAEEGPNSLLAYPQKFPVLLEKIFARALAREPDQRYRTGDELAGDLRAVAEALEQNSSPSFSRWQLPSHRDLHNSLPDVSAPAGADIPVRPKGASYESNLAELMRLIPEFETASARGDTLAARQLLSKIEAVGMADERLRETVQKYRAKLTEGPERSGQGSVRPAISKPGSPAPAPRAPAEVSSPKICGYCGSSNRGAAMYCIECGAPIPALPPKPLPVAAPPAPAPPPVAVFAPPPPLAPPPPPVATAAGAPQTPTVLFSASMIGAVPTQATQAPPLPEVQPYPQAPIGYAPAPIADAPSKPVRAWPKIDWQEIRKQVEEWPRERKLIAIVSAAAVGLIALVFLLGALWPVPLQPAVAKAEVRHSSQIRKQPKSGSAGAPVKAGDSVNILKFPESRDQQWILVQLIRKKVSAPGYIEVRDLEKWDSTNSDTKLALIRLFRHPQLTTNEQILAALSELQSLIERFPGTRAAQEASLEAAKLEILLIRRLKAEDHPPENWQKWLESARKHLAGAAGPSVSAQSIKDLQTEIDSLMPPATPPVPNPVTVRPDPHQGSVGQQAVKKKLTAAQIGQMLEQVKELVFTPLKDPAFVENLKQAESLVDEILQQEPDNAAAKQYKETIIPQRRKARAM